MYSEGIEDVHAATRLSRNLGAKLVDYNSKLLYIVERKKLWNENVINRQY